MRITQTHKVREHVSRLSSGPIYYDEISHWWDALLTVLLAHGLRPVCPDCPQVFNDEGTGRVDLEHEADGPVDNCYIRWTYYRMQSGRWEIVNYVT